MRNNASEAARAGHSDLVIIQSRQDSEFDASEYIPLPNSLEDSFVRAKSHRKRRSFKSKILSLHVVIIKAVTNLEHRAGSVASDEPSRREDAGSSGLTRRQTLRSHARRAGKNERDTLQEHSENYVKEERAQ